jgi:hypothetical protein
MASVYVTIGKAGHLSMTHQPVYTGQVRSEVITSSGTSAAGTLQANTGDIAQIFCATAVYARAGGTVTPAAGIYCPPNVPTYIGMVEGTSINVIDV